MKRVSVATLKKKLSEYLRLVEQGDEVMVTSNRRHVARLIPESGTGLIIRPPTQPLGALGLVRGVKRAGASSAVQSLLRDRARR